MKKATLARNLAHSLTLKDWSDITIEAALRRRLPKPVHALVPNLALSLFRALPAPYAPSPKIVARSLCNTFEFDQIWRFCQTRNLWPAPDLTAPEMAPIPAFATVDLPKLATLNALADWLLLPAAKLDYLADLQSRHETHGDMAVNHYHYHLTPKRQGGLRLLEAPKPALKAAQRAILRGILDKLPMHQNAFGFVKGRSCLDAAQRHAGEHTVLRFDLKDFFPSIQAGRIHGLFRCLGYPHSVSRHLTALCTTSTPPRVLNRLAFAERALYRGPHLPQGSPASPALANHLCHGLDRRLSALAISLKATYSRYADDLSFSGDTHITRALTDLVPVIAENEGFKLNLAKTRIMQRGSRQMVTGVVVNRHLNTPRAAFDRLKAIIHACSKPEDTRLSDASFRASLLGQIGWVEQVNPPRGRKLRHLLETAWAQRFAR